MKKPTTPITPLTIIWLIALVFSFALLGTISYVWVGALSLILFLDYVIGRRKSINGQKTTFLMQIILMGVLYLPLLIPGFVTIERNGFYALYSDGSSGYAENDTDDGCINCPDSEFVPLERGQKFFVTGYSYDTNIGGTHREILTPLGPFTTYNLENSYYGRDVSLTTPLFFVEMFFSFQSAINSIFFPLAFL